MENSFHSTDHWIKPETVEVAALGDFQSGPRTAVDHEPLEKVVFLYVVEGRVLLRLSDVGDVALAADDIFVVFPGRQLTVELTAPSNRIMSIALSGAGAVQAALGLGYFDLLRASERYEGNFMMELIEHFHAAPKRGRDERVLSLVEHFLTTIWLRIRHGGDGQFFNAVKSINGLVCRGECQTTEDCSRMLAMSRSKLNSIFMKGASVRPGEYISRVILLLAQASLFWTTSSVAQIAANYGFSSTSAFAVFFRRHMGMTPAAFRRNPIPPPHPTTTRKTQIRSL